MKGDIMFDLRSVLMFAWPFVRLTTYEQLHTDYRLAVCEKNNLRRKNAKLEADLKEARKNDARDPETGRYTKAKKGGCKK